MVREPLVIQKPAQEFVLIPSTIYSTSDDDDENYPIPSFPNLPNFCVPT